MAEVAEPVIGAQPGFVGSAGSGWPFWRASCSRVAGWMEPSR